MSKSRWTAVDFIANAKRPSGYSAGDIVEFIGWEASGDGGAAQWRATGNQIAASQTPALLGTKKCSDSSGNELELIPVAVTIKPSIDIRKLGANSSSDALAILNAAKAALQNGGEIEINGAFKVSAQFNLDNQGASLVGKGAGNQVNTNPSTPAPSSISGEHLSGAVVRLANNSCAISGVLVTSEPARAAATFDISSPGVLIEGPDTEFGTADRSLLNKVRVENQPGDGVLSSGSITMSTVSNCEVWSCKGMAYRFNDGNITGRTYTSYIGLVDFLHNRAHWCGGNALAVSDPSITSQAGMGVRWNIDNFEAVGCATDAAVRYSNHNVWFFGENSRIKGSACNGDEQGGGTELHGGIWAAGPDNQIINNRFIRTNQPVEIGQVPTQPTTGMRVTEIRTVQDSLTIDSVVKVADGAIVHVETDDPKGAYTNIATPTVDNVFVNVKGRHTIASVNSGRAVSIDDDNVYAIEFETGQSYSFGVVQVVGSATTTCGGTFQFRCGGTEGCLKWSGNANTVAGTGIPTGTTGNDGEVTVFAASDGKLYIENRRGFAIFVTFLFTSMGDGMRPIV